MKLTKSAKQGIIHNPDNATVYFGGLDMVFTKENLLRRKMERLNPTTKKGKQ